MCCMSSYQLSPACFQLVIRCAKKPHCHCAQWGLTNTHPWALFWLRRKKEKVRERETVKTVKKQLNGINFLCSIQSNMKVLLFYKKWWEQICSLRCFSCLSSLVYVQSRREETLNLQCSLLGDYWPFSSLLSLQYRLVWLFYFYPFR